MPARVILVHDDPAFSDAIASELRRHGHEVTTFNDRRLTVNPPRTTDVLELAVTQSTGRYGGVRVRVTGLPAGSGYAGPLGQFLPEPVNAADVAAIVRRFEV